MDGGEGDTSNSGGEGGVGNGGGEGCEDGGGGIGVDEGTVSDDSSSEVENESRDPRRVDRDDRFSFVTGTKGGTGSEGGGNESEHGRL